MIATPSMSGAGQPRFTILALRDEVRVWRAVLDPQNVLTCEQVLASDELAPAARFHFDRHRRRFIEARAFLRSTLAAYLNVSASEVQFGHSEFGKPYA